MFVIGTAGHVDHGKSLLVEALTGIDPDRLREEKARGMTIDLGFAWLTLPSGRDVSIVDVPGHERFIRNMLAGAGGVDVALLVVAADDGVMPQTREHLAILDLFDVRRGVVAVTKSDLVDAEWLAVVEDDVRELLGPGPLAGSPVVACSAVTRSGLDELLRALDAALAALPPKRDVGRPRLPVDRVFTMSGFGTVVTGTLTDGRLREGDEVELTPGGLRGRVRGLQSHREKREVALPGARTAVNIAGVDARDVRRGMVLGLPGTLRGATALDARLRGVTGVAGRVRHGTQLMLYAGADEAQARVRLLDADVLAPGGEAWAQLRLDAPLAIERGDRFVLRTPQETVAGGIVIAVQGRRRRHGDVAGLAAMLATLDAQPRDVALAAIGRRPFATQRELVAAGTVSAADMRDALDALVAEGAAVRHGNGEGALYATRAQVDDARITAEATLAEYHREHHLREGMPAQEFRARIGVPAAAIELVATAANAELRNGVVALASFAPAPAPDEAAALDAYVDAIDRGGAGEPLPPDLFAFAVQRGLIVDAGNGVIVSARAFDAMAERVVAQLRAHGSITLATARDLIGTGRKQAQAILEELDRRGVTRRTGDVRVLRQRATGAVEERER